MTVWVCGTEVGVATVAVWVCGTEVGVATVAVRACGCTGPTGVGVVG